MLSCHPPSLYYKRLVTDSVHCVFSVRFLPEELRAAARLPRVRQGSRGISRTLDPEGTVNLEWWLAFCVCLLYCGRCIIPLCSRLVRCFCRGNLFLSLVCSQPSHLFLSLSLCSYPFAFSPRSPVHLRAVLASSWSRVLPRSPRSARALSHGMLITFYWNLPSCAMLAFWRVMFGALPPLTELTICSVQIYFRSVSH